jgi:pheromone shutdown protein TraB
VRDDASFLVLLPVAVMKFVDIATSTALNVQMWGIYIFRRYVAVSKFFFLFIFSAAMGNRLLLLLCPWCLPNSVFERVHLISANSKPLSV